ncbi:MobP3 family relaxase [Sporofaciens musculi]|uniref:MobP3 family relaxase n=1 Tax=Sporofaciens musculi TaxID=2681861 RepID=UPI0025701094|nr:MobP3 family relaxase [Sporofaciens musculi]
MAKLIFTCHYVRDAPPSHLQNYVQYISTREGVEKIDVSKKDLPTTMTQKKLIRQILKDMPDTKSLLEYEDYRKQPTIGNASEFITQALEQSLDIAAMKENYVDYLANRPRVERLGGHGLFTDVGKPVILSEVKKEVSEHKGPVWTHVVSLRREDAARFGYDSAKQWMSLLRSKRAMLCKYMKIDSENLRWYAAFHNEGHHPHVHLMVYSTKESEGYLTKAGIDAMRSELAHDIFRQDFAQIYAGQNQTRSNLKEIAAEQMKALILELDQGVYENPMIVEKLHCLSKRLQNTKGKKVYGYLKADVKLLVDQIVDELSRNQKVWEAYRAWNTWQNQILQTYMSKAPELLPLSKQKQFKSIRNMVIAEAVKLGSCHFSLEELAGEGQKQMEEGEAAEKELLEVFSFKNEKDISQRVEQSMERLEAYAVQGNPYAQYILGKFYMYGTQDNPPDKEKAIHYLKASAAQGNIYARFLLEHIDSAHESDVILAATRLMHHLSKIFQDDYRERTGGSGIQRMDRKQRRKQQEKKKALGHKEDDHEPQQTMNG